LFAVHKTGCERAADFEGAGNAFHFLLAEFASAPAGKYAIIMVHKFLLDYSCLFSFRHWVRLSGPKLVKKGLFGGAGKDPAWNRLTTFVEISINGAGWSHAAFGRRPESAGHLFDFLLRQVTSAPAN
jgi:hypothetical protein